MQEIEEFKIYQIDKNGYFTGVVQTTNKFVGIPQGFTKVSLIDIPEEKFAKLEGQKWTIEEKILEEKESVLDSITPRQARHILLKMGLLDELESLITENKEAFIDWEYATEIKRDFPLINLFGQKMGLIEEQIDNMFIEASKIK